MALDRLLQIGAPLGIYRDADLELQPDGSAYAIQGLVDDAGLPYHRGRSTYKSNAAVGATGLYGLWSGTLVPGVRTAFYNATRFDVLNVDDATPVELATGQTFLPTRMVNVAGIVMAPDANASPSGFFQYAGSVKTGGYSTGTVALTNGAAQAAGTGTAFTANVDAGMILRRTGLGVENTQAVVSSVASNTLLNLARPWEGATGTGYAYIVSPLDSPVVELDGLAPSTIFASVANRLLWVPLGQNLVAFSGIGQPAVVDDFHGFSAKPIALAALRDSGMVFTEGGVYQISNMAYELVDAAGNPQQRVDLVNADLIAWGHEGIAPWAGALVVPALDNIWLLDGVSSPTQIGTGILDLYLSYVRAGYVAGVAEVFNGHYFLPILNPASSYAFVDLLVCRLRPPAGGTGPVWTQLANSAAAVRGLAERSSNPPLLLGASSLSASRVTNLTGFFTPSSTAKTDADGTGATFSYTTRAFSTGNLQSNFVKKVRARYVLTDAASDNPTMQCEVSINGAAFSTLNRTTTGTQAPESDGSVTYSWVVGKRARSVRFRFSSQAASPLDCTFKAVEIFTRHTGRY